MKRYRLSYQRRARDDLDNLYYWIVENQGSTRIADKYTQCIKRYIDDLTSFPHRGTKRDDLLPGLRIIGFERRVAIAFHIFEENVLVLRIFYGGRDLDILREDGAALIADDESGEISET